MTESLHAAQRRVGALQAPDEVDAEPAPVRPVPVVGLVFGTPQDDQLGGPIARPGSVVEALRRQSIRGQAIRRSGRGAAMEISDDESESDEEPDPWAGTADEAGDHIVQWLRARAGAATNYTVAVCNGRIIITKVNGVTEATALMGQLRDRIEERGIDQTFRIYLCQKYAPGQPSNHAEMCLVAAVGAANLNNITFFECTSPSCDYCDTFLDHYNVPNTSPDGEPASQAGWLHPFARVAFGTQLGDHATQVQELAAYLDDPDTAELVVGRVITTAPRQGRLTHWLG